MLRLSELRLPLDHAPGALVAAAATALGVAPAAIGRLDVFKRSFDARRATLLVVHTVDLELTDPALEPALLARHAGNPRIARTPDMRWQPPAVANATQSRQRPVVVGFGPCGIFAALTLAQLGLKPIVLERGRDVRLRTRDTWGLWRRGVLDTESNVQFGEGGAGTFSDGKLYSQIRDPRWLGRKVMQEFVAAGAPTEILVAAHPHIGTFKLVKVVERLRAQIIALGGEVRFEQRVTDLLIEDGQLRGLLVQDRTSGAVETLRADQMVLALGHSARDTFEMLNARGVAMQAKPFSIGFRIEHPQSLIDRARWGRHAGHPALGAADYKLVHHVDAGPGAGRSVYSFCMCPGGTVVAATSEDGRVATNGMSQYSRNERNANAAIVVGIEPADFAGFGSALQLPGGETAVPGTGVHPLAGIALQRALESAAFVLGGADYCAPGQRVGDFLAGCASKGWGTVEPSYQPGVRPTDLGHLLPDYAIAAIRSALPVFGRQIKGFDAADAVLTAVETRTSSPLRIARGEADLQSPTVRGLYPAGEGAGYAGGILSAGVDGIRVAEALATATLPAAPATRKTAFSP